MKREVLSGVLVSIFEHGVLITGPSGAGKSACALDLLAAGHRLAADDVVEVERNGDLLIGSSPTSLRGLIEVRGLGICDVRRLFGANAVVESQRIDLIVELRLKTDLEGERLEPVSQVDICGVSIPKVILIASGACTSRTFVETAVRFYAAGGAVETAEFITRFDRQLQNQKGPSFPDGNTQTTQHDAA